MTLRKHENQQPPIQQVEKILESCSWDVERAINCINYKLNNHNNQQTNLNARHHQNSSGVMGAKQYSFNRANFRL